MFVDLDPFPLAPPSRRVVVVDSVILNRTFFRILKESTTFCHFTQAEIFQVGCVFASIAAFKEAVKRLKWGFHRQLRANAGNNKRRLALQCSTVIGAVYPPNRKDGGCPFFVRATKERDGTVIVREVNLQHTCTIAASLAAHRSKLPAPQAELDAEAAKVVRQTVSGLRTDALEERMQDKGFKVPKDQARRALARENRARHEVLASENIGALVSWVYAFNEIGNGNYGEVLYKTNGAVMAVANVSGAVVNMVSDQTKCPLLNAFSVDASHFGAVARERDAEIVVGENYSGLGGIEETFGKPTGTRGRPKRTTVGLGRLLVCTARTFAGDIVLVATAYVSTESTETVEWFLNTVESRVALVENFGKVNFIADRSKAISSAIERVYGDSAFLAHCFVHIRRNLQQHLSGEPNAQEAVSCLNRCYVARTPEAHAIAMAEMRRVSEKAHKYMSQIELKRWAIVHLPFNCNGNLTSNDAEGTFSTVEEKKITGDVCGTYMSVWENSSMNAYTLWKQSQERGRTFTSPKLEGRYQGLLREAAQAVVKSRKGPNHMTVAVETGSRESYTVDLTNPQDKDKGCSCRADRQDVLRCVHIFGAILEGGALGKDLESVFPKGALIQPDGSSPFCTLELPATGDLFVASNVKAPPWLRLVLPRKKVPEHAIDRMRPVGLSPMPRHRSGVGKRILSAGEYETIVAARESSKKDTSNQKVRLTLEALSPPLKHCVKSSNSKDLNNFACPSCGHFELNAPVEPYVSGDCGESLRGLDNYEDSEEYGHNADLFETPTCAVDSDEEYVSADDGNGEVSDDGSTHNGRGLKRALAKSEPLQVLQVRERLENICVF